MGYQKLSSYACFIQYFGMAIEITVLEGRDASGKENRKMPQVEAFKRVIEMNDQEILYLKFQKRCSTQQLLRRFPRQKRRIAEVALLDLSVRRLHRVIQPGQKGIWARLRALKKKFRQLRQRKRADHEAVLIWR